MTARALPSLARLRDELTADRAGVAERAPHVATRVVVDRDGQGFVRELYDAFDRLNRLHFAGRLQPPLVQVTFTAPRALGDHAALDPHGLRSVIRLHPRTVERGFLFACDVLLHEMVHTWAIEIAKDDEAGYRGHGPKFAEQCNAVGERLGLGPVGVKRRKGLPDCAQWPVCVRGPGYYGNDAAELERQKRTRVRAHKAPAEASAPSPGEVLEDGEDLGPPTSTNRGAALSGAARLCERASAIFRARRRPIEQKTLATASALLRELAGEAGPGP